MPSKPSLTTFSTFSSLTLGRSHLCKTCRRSLRLANTTPTRLLSTSQPLRLDLNIRHEDRPPPRWSQTPERMTAPVRIRPRPRDNNYVVNEDPEKLDAVYNKVLGPGGQEMLTDEVKWLAVTHKSFDHGRRGYNDRLGFFGRRILDLQVSLAIINSNTPIPHAEPDQFGRTPFRHPALDASMRLDYETKDNTATMKELADLAFKYGLLAVVRWKPKRAEELRGSGSNMVLAQALYAILGAVSLEHGGEVANRVAKERILKPMGVVI